MFSSLQSFNCKIVHKTKFLSHEKVVKINTLLTKFQQCYLYLLLFIFYTCIPLSRYLCRHEVALIGIRCSSIGCWFPTAFPSVSIISKFPVLKHQFPGKASIRRTIGMEAEHSSAVWHTNQILLVTQS